MESGVRHRHIAETIYPSAVCAARGFCSIPTRAGRATVSSRTLKGGVCDARCAAANPNASTLRRSPEAAVGLTILILVSAFAAIRVSRLNSRTGNVERTVAEIDRATLRIGACAIIKVAAVAARRCVTRESAIGNTDVAARAEAGKAA